MLPLRIELSRGISKSKALFLTIRRPETAIMPKTVTSIAILNSSQDTIEVLRMALVGEGFGVVSAHVSSVKSGELDLLEFAERHTPDVFIYDIALPYEENWKFLRLLQSSEALKDIKWVLT